MSIVIIVSLFLTILIAGSSVLLLTLNKKILTDFLITLFKVVRVVNIKLGLAD